MACNFVILYGYPPNSVFKQSVYTALVGSGGFFNKVDVSEEDAQAVLKTTQEVSLFQPAGREHKCLINRAFSESEIETLLRWIESVAGIIKKQGLKD